jgi:hypothetical protein
MLWVDDPDNVTNARSLKEINDPPLPHQTRNLNFIKEVFSFFQWSFHLPKLEALSVTNKQDDVLFIAGNYV